MVDANGLQGAPYTQQYVSDLAYASAMSSAAVGSITSSLYSPVQAVYGGVTHVASYAIPSLSATSHQALQNAYYNNPIGQVYNHAAVDWTDYALHAATYTAWAAVGATVTAAAATATWAAYGGAQFAIGANYSAQSAIRVHISFGYATNATSSYTAASGLGSGYFVTSAAQALFRFILYGIPIYNSTYIANWVATNPYCNNCLFSAYQAFWIGWGRRY